jgi:hypothetical protein
VATRKINAALAEDRSFHRDLASAIGGFAQFAKLLLKVSNKQRSDIGFARVRRDKIYRTPRVASNMSEVRFVAVNHRFAMCTVLFLVIALLLSACASSEEPTTSESAPQSTGTVPGEKMSDDGRYAPGPAGGSVHW